MGKKGKERSVEDDDPVSTPEEGMKVLEAVR